MSASTLTTVNKSYTGDSTVYLRLSNCMKKEAGPLEKFSSRNWTSGKNRQLLLPVKPEIAYLQYKRIDISSLVGDRP